jgi:thioredoxin-related protein
LEGRTLLSIPGYDPKEKFEFGVITSFAEGSGKIFKIFLSFFKWN